MNRSACPGPQTIPESAYAPLPLEPSNENVDSVSFVIMKVPLAAVLPFTPIIVTVSPVWRRWFTAVVITIGVAFVASEMRALLPTAVL